MGRSRGRELECFDSNILDILRCVSSLDELVCDVLSCMCVKPNERRIQEILTCVVLNEVGLLSNATIGLNEIKNEVRFIENEVTLINDSVNNPIFGLNQISNEVNLINNSINNLIFGLAQINSEVRFIDSQTRIINNSVNNPLFGLNQINNEARFIDNEVRIINNSINNPLSGLSQINNEVRFIDNEVRIINNSINSQIFGLNEINNQVRFIEDEIILVNDSVNSPVFGLNEIKNDIDLIEKISLHNFHRVTSGPIFTHEDARRLTVKVFNSSAMEQTVRIKVFDLDQSPAVKIFDRVLEIAAFSADQFSNIRLSEEIEEPGCGCNCSCNDDYEYGNCDRKMDSCDDRMVESFEIVIDNIAAGIYPAAVQTRKGRDVIESTFIKSAEFIPKTGLFEPI